MRYGKEIDTAVNAARKASALYMGNDSAVRAKGNDAGIYDVVSDNDVDAERIIMDTIRAEFPEDSFICEESGEQIRSERRWIIDPIDGTINYVRGIPVFGTQIALTEGDQPLISVMYLPSSDELFTAEKGCGAYMNGKRLNMRRTVRMKESVLSIGDYSRGSAEFRINQSRLMDVLRDSIGRIRMMGSSCFDFCSFAAGRTEYHARFIRNPWDFVPGFLMAEESGAVYDEDLYTRKKLYVAACSEENLQEIVSLISERMEWYL